MIDFYKLVKRYGMNKVQQCINITDFKQPKNPGGYFRQLLNSNDISRQNKPIKKDLDTNPYKKENNTLDYCKKILTINEKRPSNLEIIQDMMNKGNIQEAKYLMTLWKLKI